MALKGRIERFCLEFIIDNNGTQAAIRAGYSEKTAKVRASQLLAKPEVQARIAELNRELLDGLNVSAEQVLEELAAIAFSDITEVLDVSEVPSPSINGLTEIRVTLKDFSNLPKRVTTAIESIAVVKGELRVKMHSKQPALESLAKRVGFYPKQMALLEAMAVLAREGVMTEDHARIIHDGIQSMEAKLKSLPRSESYGQLLPFRAGES